MGFAFNPLTGKFELTFSYLHTQSSASATWTVNHNSGFKPTVSVYSPGGVELTAEILHISNNQLTISFSSPQTGFARTN